MARMQTHHIEYKPDEWTVDLPGHMHKVVTIIQRTNPTMERYAVLTGFLHAITYIWNLYRRELDLNDEWNV